MKIFMVASLYPPFVVCGAEFTSQTLAEEMVRQGHSVLQKTAPDLFAAANLQGWSTDVASVAKC